MAVPMIHARNSVKHFGGKPEDYLDIHEFIDLSGAAFPDLRHRALTHNTWFIKVVIPKAFGQIRTNSEGKEYSTVLVAQWHVLEDFDGRFIPSPQDFLAGIPFAPWMDNGKDGASPPSHLGMPGPEKPKEAEPEALVLELLPGTPGTPVEETGPPSEPPREPARGCRNGPPGAFD